MSVASLRNIDSEYTEDMLKLSIANIVFPIIVMPEVKITLVREVHKSNAESPENYNYLK